MLRRSSAWRHEIFQRCMNYSVWRVAHIDDGLERRGAGRDRGSIEISSWLRCIQGPAMTPRKLACVGPNSPSAVARKVIAVLKLLFCRCCWLRPTVEQLHHHHRLMELFFTLFGRSSGVLLSCYRVGNELLRTAPQSCWKSLNAKSVLAASCISKNFTS